METLNKRTGRPKAFDIEKALDKALLVFWSKGYEGASLTDLTEAMGINRPSLYTTFGNKEELFRKALDRYVERMSPAYQVLDGSPARTAVEGFLNWIIDAQTDPSTPQGCLAVQGALACGSESEAIRNELCARRNQGEMAIRMRLERAKLEGELPAHADVADLARYFTALSQGLAVQAAGGVGGEALKKVVSTAMAAWPV